MLIIDLFFFVEHLQNLNNYIVETWKNKKRELVQASERSIVKKDRSYDKIIKDH